MKRQISNPYKINWKIYGLVFTISVILMIISVALYEKNQKAIIDVAKNLTFGCVASTIVAFLIEIGNIKDKNEKALSVYDAVYADLKCQIIMYLDTWSQLCSVAFKDKDYSTEMHTWSEWYDITKRNFLACDDDKQDELIQFFNDRLLLSIERIETALRQIDLQQYLLNINEVYNESLKIILSDFSFEFMAAKLTLKHYNKDDFWEKFDAIKCDLINYINNWIDIKYFNYYRFRPFNFNNDKAEILRAANESECTKKN